MRPIARIDFPIEDYLKRIGLDKAPACDEDGLHQIHSAQAFSIPFENIECFLKLPIAIDKNSLCNKLIRDRRGGYCFELNGLLALALQHLGFATRPLLGRGMYRVPGIDPRTHYFHLAQLNGRDWIVDAGFGGPGLMAPIPLEIDRIDIQCGQQFKLVNDQNGQIILQRHHQDAWENLYSFTKETIYEVDVDMANFFASSAPTSIFRRHLLCSLPKNEGKVSIFDKIFFQSSNQPEKQSPADILIESSDQLGQILDQYFTIKYSTVDLDMVYKRLSEA